MSFFLSSAKCLGGSHAAQSVSLYMPYKTWREKNGLKEVSIKAFKHNRFGRTAFLALTILDQLDNIRQFFAEVVNENSNLLVLAVYSYIHSDWFIEGCNVYKVSLLISMEILCSRNMNV